MEANENISERASRIGQHDPESFHELYIRYISALEAFAFRYTYNNKTAKDLGYDAFVYLWKYPEKINIHQDITYLLFNMTRNNCLNYLRPLRIRDGYEEKLTEALLFSVVLSLPEETGDQQQLLIRKLNSALSLLPSQSHRILLLHIVDGLKMKGIALPFKIAEPSVKTHIKRAMKNDPQ